MKLIPFLVIPVGGLTMFVLGVLMIVDAITTAIRRQRLRRQVRQPPLLPRRVRPANEDRIGS
jgi:hypothetical protein